MADTRQELLEFNRFAEARLADGRTLTLQKLLDEWNAQREHEQSVAAIRKSVEQYNSGQVTPAREAIDEVRKNLGRGR